MAGSTNAAFSDAGRVAGGDRPPPKPDAGQARQAPPHTAAGPAVGVLGPRPAGPLPPAGPRRNTGPGVPEAIARAVSAAGERLGPSSIDKLWLFPPLVRGRREQGLVVAGCFAGRGSRRLVTVRYSAQRTGKGLYFDARFVDEGVAPPERFPAMMEGVAERSPEPLGSPRVVEVGGEAEAFASLLRAYPAEMFDEEPAGTRPPA